MNNDKRRNDLDGKSWLQNSFSIWRDIRKSPEEKKLAHPASYPSDLVEKLIRSFSRNGSHVVDPFGGVGSTMEGCLKAGSTGVSIDLSPEFCKIASERCGQSSIEVLQGDNIKVLTGMPDAQFDLCITSPPYWDILSQKRSADKKINEVYSESQEDIGNIAAYTEFLDALEHVFEQVYRTLKNDRYCIVNVMDLRKKDKFFPLHSDLADRMKKIGFIYDDIIIWDRAHEYNNMKPLGYPYRFRINKVHEYLLIFLKK